MILTNSHIRDNISHMKRTTSDTPSIDFMIAHRLKELRAERGWSLDDLARRSTVSRATLSRLENAEVSPTASVLNKLCSAYGLTMSRLLYLVENDFVPLIRRDAQAIWIDRTSGFRRRSVSPPAQALAGEVLECELEAGTSVTYDRPPREGLEHHLLLLEGQLEISLNGRTYELRPGDCLRYQLFGPSAFATPAQCAARYLLFVV
jgi:transcriptional regulator with XRE-family HTH domain